MIDSEKIHQSVIDADDLEEIRGEEISVGDVFGSLVQHPAQIITRWNWKSAMLGAVLRASFYFTIYNASKKLAGDDDGGSGRIRLSVFYVRISGALVQSFRRAQPIWLQL